MSLRERLTGSQTRLQKVTLAGEELEPEDAIDKALKGMDEAICDYEKAGQKLVKQIVKFRSEPPCPSEKVANG